jgi:hypothetical protein
VFGVTVTFNVVSLNSVALSVTRNVKLAFVAVTRSNDISRDIAACVNRDV